MAATGNRMAHLVTACVLSLVTACLFTEAGADERQLPVPEQPAARKSEHPLLTPEEWTLVDRSVDRGIEFLARQQDADGSFPSAVCSQPGITSLCVMAMLARGHQPGKGRYGRQLERAIDFVLTLQDPRTGAITDPTVLGQRREGVFGTYNHAISGVMLGEVYGMTGADRHERIRTAIQRALRFTRELQTRPRENVDRGGWRYLLENGSDLSVTSWHLMFLRSARNAEFDVPEAWVKEAMGYIHRTFNANEKGFMYALHGSNRICTRGTVGAGIVNLSLGGEHHSETARLAGDWVLRHAFEPYNNHRSQKDGYHYGAFYCSQAMFQLGGDYWDRFFPKLLRVLADAQNGDGSWPEDSLPQYEHFGKVYSTSLSVLALATPYQILPIYQR
jgi:hypothetical protein